MPRPTSYTDAIGDEFCERLADDRSERSICRDKDMPDRETVRRWRKENAEFAAKCARAREEQSHTIVDKMGEVEEKTLREKLDPAAARAVLSSMQWRAAKLGRAHYGNAGSLELTGKDGGPIKTVAAQIVIDPVDAAAAYKDLMLGEG